MRQQHQQRCKHVLQQHAVLCNCSNSTAAIVTYHDQLMLLCALLCGSRAPYLHSIKRDALLSMGDQKIAAVIRRMLPLQQ